MTNRLISVGCASLLWVFSACGPADVGVGDAEDGRATTAAPLQALRLIEAHQVIGALNGEGRWTPYRAPLADLGYGATLTGMVRGLVEVPSAGPNAKVVVHFNTHASNDWQPQEWHDVEARRVDATHWEFATTPLTMGNSFHYIPRFVTTFALKLVEGGHTTWDNNDGNNFVISGDDDGGWVPVYAGPPAILAGPALVLESAWWDGAHLRGTVVVRNTGPNKTVKVVATTNAWASRAEGVASYVKTFGQTDFERWAFDVVAPATALERVEFAAVVEGPTGSSWDNNLGRNHSLRLDGQGSAWALGPVQSPGRIAFEGPAQGLKVSVTRAPPADGALYLVYDPQRLPQCRATKYGRPAWGLAPYVRAPGSGPFEAQSLQRLEAGLENGPLLTAVFHAATKGLEVYVVNSDAAGCVAWDSHFGQNFVLRW